MKKVKKFINDIYKKLKKIWNKDYRDIVVPVLSIIIFIVSLLSIGFIWALIILILINGIYFSIGIFNKKKKKKTKKKSNTKNSQKNNTKNKSINKTKKGKKKKTFKILLLIFLACFILGIIGIIAFFSYIVANAPEFNAEALYVTEPTVLLDKKGNEITKLGTEKRIILDYDEIPEVLIDAIVATEDSKFFEHNGVNWARFLKASFLQLLGRSEAGGASTLTMQVSKNTHTSNESSGIQGIIRKFTDVYVSIFKIEKNYTKEQILSFYVNSHYLGKNAYGVEQVSLNYFGKSAKELNLAEAAMIAGLFQAPGRYDPYKNPEATESRRQTVLKLMLRHGYISKDEYNIAKEMSVEELVISQEESNYSSGEVSKYQSFIDTVVEEVEDKTGKNPYTTPMTIYTTLDTEFQNYITNIMNGENYDWENDVVQAGVAVLNIKDGSVAAIGGGRNVDAIDKYNYATDITKQIGSTAKPLYDYGPAIEYNNWSPYNLVADEPTTYSDGHSINNWDGRYQGLQSIRIALKGSRNIPALKTFKAINKSNIIKFVTNLGLTPEIYSCNEGYTRDGKYCINKENPNDIIDAKQATTLHEAHSIGGYNGESPLTMAAAYAAFGNKGTYIKPYTFTKVIFHEDDKEITNEIKKTKAMSEETAYIISDMLATTATQAMGRYYNINGIKYAAKTGTTNYDEATMKANKMPNGAVNDLWVVGYNTEYSIGVWYGYNKIDNKYYNKFSSSQNTRLLQAIGKKVFTNKSSFTRPSGVVEVEVESECVEAMLPSEYTPSNLRQKELFIKGTEPTTTSPRFAKLSDVSNLKATTNENTVHLSWDNVTTPEINTENYLRQQFSKIFSNNSYLNSYIGNRMNYINAHVGTLGYNIYIKDTSGNLKLLDFTNSNKYETTIDQSGEYTFVIKTSYSIFKNNMSDGKSVKVNITVNSPIIPEPDDTEENEDLDNTTNNENTNTNTNANTKPNRVNSIKPNKNNR